MVSSPAVRSGSGRSSGTLISADRTRSQYAVVIPPSCQPISWAPPATGRRPDADRDGTRRSYAVPVPSLLELVRSHTDLDEDDVGVLQLLMADWQIIADLSFADLVLWLPDRGGGGFWAAGQMRPTTGPTAYVDDVVGSFVPAGRRPMLDRADADARLRRGGDPEWPGGRT